MEQRYLICRKCKKETKHVIFNDHYNLPDRLAVVQCYECEVMGVSEVKNADV